MTSSKNALRRAGPGRADASPQGPGRRKPVGSVVNVLRILERLSVLDSPIRVTHLARELGINLSTCYNILDTLVQQGYVRFSPHGKGYSIGTRVAQLARGALDPRGALSSVQPEMRRIAQQHDLILTVWRRSAVDRMTLVAACESDAAIRLHLTVGHSIPLLLGSVGRVMATRVELDEAELASLFARVRWNEPIDFRRFMLEARRARERGYAVDNAVASRGLFSIACPIVADGAPVDAVCCASMFAGSYPQAVVAAIARELEGLCRSIAQAGG